MISYYFINSKESYVHFRVYIISDPSYKCFDVSIYKPTPEYEWSFGPCISSAKWLGSGTYTDKCCISSGQHILRCSTRSWGRSDWSNSVVMILGHYFCDDFVGYTAIIGLNISGILSIWHVCVQ